MQQPMSPYQFEHTGSLFHVKLMKQMPQVTNVYLGTVVGLQGLVVSIYHPA